MSGKYLPFITGLLLLLIVLLFKTMSTSDRLFETFQNPANSVKCLKLREQEEKMLQILKTQKPMNDEDRKGKALLEIELASMEKQIKELGC